MLVRSFPPVIDDDSRILILGSMPGEASLKAHRYYWNPRNYMWTILYKVFENREPDPEYEDRLAFAGRNGIALWDAIAECEREGSLDGSIRFAEPNDIPGLLRDYPAIRAIVCNGTKSYGEVTRHFADDPEVGRRELVKLPSSSPIPTKHYRNLEDRLQAWRVLERL